MNKFVAAITAAVAIASVPAAAASAFASFNGTNGNGGFTYGYTDGTTLTAFNTSDSGASCALSGATCLTSSTLGAVPFASVGGSLPSVNVPLDAIVVHPGDSDPQSAYVSFTTPVAGSFNYNIDIQSRGIDTTNGIGYRSFKLVGGLMTLGARSVIPNYLGTANLSGTITPLGLGDQFGVIIDRNGSYFGDSTGIKFNASAVPEPAAWGLMIIGFGMAGAAARRRSTAVTV